MRYRKLGASGLLVSEIVLGTMTFGDREASRAVGSTRMEVARGIMDRAVDRGVNLIDTADIYGGGRCEEIVGELLKGRRDEVLLATKGRFSIGEGPNAEGSSRYHLVRACEASLRRLQTDYIDLYQVHEWDALTPVHETMSALDTLVRDGKVRYVGCSNYTAWQLMKSLGEAERVGLERFVSQQVYYSMIGRDVEIEVIPAALDQGVGILVWAPMAGGLLSGKYRRGKEGPAGARHTGGWAEPPIADWDHVYDVIEVLADVADGRGISGAEVALSWLRSRPGVTGIVVGARNEDQLEDNLASVEVVLTDDELSRLNVVSLPELPYPHWHQKAVARDRLGPTELAFIGQYA